MNESVPALKDETAQHPIASAWRPALSAVVSAFAKGDYALNQCPAHVAPVRASVSDQVQKYIASYGETLIELPEESWRTSAAQWMRAYWDILVDLWTAESGRSDLALCARVYEVDEGFRIEILSVHVP